MELRFISPELRRLDLAVGEVLMLPVVLGERPPRGVLGLVDYRLNGRISKEIKAGTVKGELDSAQILLGRPRLNFDKILLLGMGAPEGFNTAVYTRLVDSMLELMVQMNVRRAVVELPGRALSLIEAEAAAEILLERAADRPHFDTWTLLEAPAAARVMAGRARSERRRSWDGKEF